MRLDKYVARATELSRTDVKRLIKQGEVSINNLCTNNPGQHISPGCDDITLSGTLLNDISDRYLMLYKPEGVICANTDGENPTVIDLINEPRSHLLHVAGRLDKDTTGLVLLTDDGQWNHRVTSPRQGCFKMYEVYLEKEITDEMVMQLSQGVLLHGEKKPTRPANVSIKNHFCIELAIQEGRYHQIKRMLAAVGNRVESLFRRSIGPITLDDQLSPGEYRPLTQNEIHYFA